jgi:hypothetical protein
VEVGPRNLAGIPAEACKAKRPRCFVIDQPWNRPVLHSPLSMRRSPASAPAPRTRKCAPGRTSMVLSTLGGDTDVSKSSGMCRSWTRPATFAPTPMALHLVVGWRGAGWAERCLAESRRTLGQGGSRRWGCKLSRKVRGGPVSRCTTGPTAAQQPPPVQCHHAAAQHHGPHPVARAVASCYPHLGPADDVRALHALGNLEVIQHSRHICHAAIGRSPARLIARCSSHSTEVWCKGAKALGRH